MLNDEFKVGDIVSVIGMNGVQSIRKISRILKTKIVLDNGREFKRNGHGHGSWSTEFIRATSQEDKNEFRIKQIRFIIDHKIEWSAVPLSVLETVNDLLKPYRLKENN